MTAYIMFSQEYMAARPVSPGDKYITKDRQVAVATAWKALSEAEKEVYFSPPYMGFVLTSR
jgi:hypothetical protein